MRGYGAPRGNSSPVLVSFPPHGQGERTAIPSFTMSTGLIDSKLPNRGIMRNRRVLEGGRQRIRATGLPRGLGGSG